MAKKHITLSPVVMVVSLAGVILVTLLVMRFFADQPPQVIPRMPVPVATPAVIPDVPDPLEELDLLPEEEPGEEDLASEETENLAPEEEVFVPSAEGNFVIQVASFRDTERADTIASELTQKGIPAIVTPVDLGEQGTWYRVEVGDFMEREAAAQRLTDVQQYYQDSFIRARD